ncbi:RCC1 domain-containing protein [Yinghuangia sp. YIM S10712]|uniref:RCC1 domain-containing protein n=1 Tax=Yinghuangia sp. YIM S10712 TaxID=3436930 RepID=UPI003F52BA03
MLLASLAACAVPAAPQAAAQAQRVESWGANDFGELGDGTTDERHTPVTAAGLTAAGVTRLAAGGNHGLAVLSNGTVKAWGANDFGQLGDGTTSSLSDPDHLTPGTVRELSGVTAVAAGCTFSLALLSDGTVKAWGNNFSGQLGNGTSGSISNNTPVTVIDPANPSAPLRGVTAIAAGCDHSLALLSNGTVKAWGANDHGQLGNGTVGGDTGTPVTVVDPGNPGAPLTGVRDIDGGLSHSLALRFDGTVRAWGDNSDGQVGNGSIGGDTGTPVTVVNLTGIVDVDAGDSHSLARRLDGIVRAWGDNSDGQLGNGSIGGASGTPANVVNLTGVRDISAGGVHNLARRSDGSLRAWGGNDSGQLGNGSTADSGAPVTVRTGIGTITRIAAGGNSSLAA